MAGCFGIGTAPCASAQLYRVTLKAVGFSDVPQLLKIAVPLPDFEVQKAIVSEIEAEQTLVNGNRDLIARFEKKIDAAIARVWGEAKGEVAA